MAEISDIVEELAQLPESEELHQFSSPKIQRVPAILLQNPNFAKYCIPKIISFGPIHHSNKDLKQGQRYKARWTSRYIKEHSKQISRSIKEAADLLYKSIEDKIGELKKLFSDESIGTYSDEELAWMLFVDGCSLLYYMRHVDSQCPEALGLKLDQLMYTWRDILLLENQLPLRVLELLSGRKGAQLVMLVYNFQTLGIAKQERFHKMALNDNSIHILDFCRSAYISLENKGKSQQDGSVYGGRMTMASQTYKNIRDLKTAGIHVKTNKTDNWLLRDVHFTSGWFGGELKLPKCRFNDIMPYFFTNLIAYEMCPDFQNDFEFCSFFTFMDSLIDDAADVKELRLAGVFPNSLNSDEDLAKFFNEIGRDLPTNLLFNNPQFDSVVQARQYKELTLKIQNHYTNSWKTWLAEARNTYFNTPWSLIAFLAALAALVLTAVQTWYAIHPKS